MPVKGRSDECNRSCNAMCNVKARPHLLDFCRLTLINPFDSTERQKSNNIKSHDLCVHTYSTFLQLILCNQWKLAQKTEKIASINQIASFPLSTFTLHLIRFDKSLIVSLITTDNKPDAIDMSIDVNWQKWSFNKNWITIYICSIFVFDKNQVSTHGP